MLLGSPGRSVMDDIVRVKEKRREVQMDGVTKPQVTESQVAES